MLWNHYYKQHKHSYDVTNYGLVVLYIDIDLGQHCLW